MEKFIYPNFPNNDFLGEFIFLVSDDGDTKKEKWSEELQSAVGTEFICRGYGLGKFSAPNQALKEIIEGADLCGPVTVSSGKTGKVRMNYSYGGGSAEVIFSLRSKRFFNTFNAEDREELHRLYGGKQYYWSNSGLSGAGYLLPSPEENDLVSLPVYRDEITHLSEAWPKEVNGIKMMVPVSISKRNSRGEFRQRRQPIIVMEIDGVICFVESANEMLEFLTGKKPEKAEIKTWKYKYLHGEVSVKWWDHYGREKVTAMPLPYKFHEFVSLFYPEMIERAKQEDSYAGETLGHIVKCLKVNEFADGSAVRYGLFNLPIEKIEKYQERFVEGQLFPWENGWVSSKNFIYRRKDEKIYAVYECKGSELSAKFSDDLVEYEQEVSIFDWFAKPVGEWISEMRIKAFDKAKNEYLNSARWSASQQKSKVQELLQNNLETIFMVQDSLDSGNCLPGTNAWMETFGVKEPISAKALIEHKKFKEMLESSRFRAVVLLKLFSKIEGSDFVVDPAEDDV